MTLREKQLDIPLPNRLIEKSAGRNQHSIHTFTENNICVFDEFAIKWCTKCASSTIQKIYWTMMRKPDNFLVSWDKSFQAKYSDIELKPRLEYISDKPLYAFYRDPIERFVSSCNFLLWEISERQPEWSGPSSISEMIEFVKYYNVVRTSDIFWPQSIYLIKPDLYEAVYKTSFLNRFLNSWGIDVNDYGSEKVGLAKGPFYIDQLSDEDIRMVKDLYHMDYLLGWGE